MRDNFSTHPQAPRSYILVLASMLIFNTGPVFAQQTGTHDAASIPRTVTPSAPA